MNNKRTYERTPVEWPAVSKMQVDVFEESFDGVFKDITPLGSFFLPLSARFNNLPISHNRFVNMFKKGDEVTVRSGKLITKAKVVWRGNSKRHNCAGIGLSFI